MQAELLTMSLRNTGCDGESPGKVVVPVPWLTSATAAVRRELAAFARHGLKEVGEQSLMSRYDTKYILPLSLLLDFLQQARADYSLLEIEGRSVHGYRTVYFDTPEFTHYFAHHNNRAPRRKVRCRTYVETGRCYLEVKCKNNKGRTDKDRVAVAADITHDEVIGLLQQAPFTVGTGADNDMRGRVVVEYQRLSLWSHKHGERVSIDLDLRVARNDAASGLNLGGIAVVEVKQASINRVSPARDALRRFGLRPRSFSKYCVACALLFPLELRCNSFKKLLLQLAPYIESESKRWILPCQSSKY